MFIIINQPIVVTVERRHPSVSSILCYTALHSPSCWRSVLHHQSILLALFPYFFYPVLVQSITIFVHLPVVNLATWSVYLRFNSAIFFMKSLTFVCSRMYFFVFLSRLIIHILFFYLLSPESSSKSYSQGSKGWKFY